MSKNNNFISKSAGLYNLLGITEWAAFKIMALGTAVMFGGMGHNYAMNNIPEWNWIVVLVAVFLGYFSVDWGLGSLIKYYYDNRKEVVEDEQQQAVRSALFRWILTLIVFRFISSWSMSLLSNTAVANIATDDLNAEYFIDSANKQDSIRNSNISVLKIDYNGLIKTEKSRLKEAKKEGHNIIRTAFNSGDYWQKNSYNKSKFSWLESVSNPDKKDKKFAAKLRQAVADSAALVKQVYEKTTKAEVRYNSASNDTTTLSVSSKILALGDIKAKERTQQLSTRYNFLTIAVSVFGILGWICVYIRSLLRRAGVDYQRQRTLSHVLNSIFNSWGEWILIQMEILFKVDLDGDGTIGSVGSSPTSSTGLFGRMKSFLSPKRLQNSGKQIGASAVANQPTTATTTTATTGGVQHLNETTTTKGTTALEYKPPVVVKGFHNKNNEEETTTTTTTVVPPTSVPTGVSPVVEDKETTTTHEIVVQQVHGIGYVVHNRIKRDKSWCRKTLNAYIVRKKNYEKKGSDTRTVDANIDLFKTYIHQIDEMEKSAEN